MHTFQCAFFLPIKLTFYNTFGTINDNTSVIKVKLLFMFKKFLALFILAPILGISQNTSIGNNEKLSFSASYNISGLLTEIAQITMETSEVKTSSATLLRLKCSATTYSSFDSYFKIRDLYESYVSTTNLTPYLYKRDINEGNYNKFEQYKFYHKTKNVESIMRKKKRSGDIEEKKTVGVEGWKPKTD